jgi:D-tyrosyl-tRNA(Tyr) deacylase
MKTIIQRVTRASVTIGADRKDIGKGLVVLVGIGENDTEKDALWLSDKILGLRIFSNEQGKFDYSVSDIKGDILAVSQFTLYADCSRRKRPDFTKAAKPDKAKKLYDFFVETLRASGLRIETGKFAADMLVEILNNGPVTILLETDKNT